MGGSSSVPGLNMLLEPCVPRSTEHDAVFDEDIPALAQRVRAEYEEMPGLRLTVAQAARLFGLAPEVAHAVLDDLQRAFVLTCSDRGTYSLRD